MHTLSRALLTLWLAGVTLSVAYAIATIGWGQGPSVFKRAGQRLLYGLIWPLALLTHKGRKQMAAVFTDQGVRK